MLPTTKTLPLVLKCETCGDVQPYKYTIDYIVACCSPTYNSGPPYHTIPVNTFSIRIKGHEYCLAIDADAIYATLSVIR